MFRSKREAAAWLGGIIDGEGSIWQSGGGREVQIVNTDEALLAGVYEACDQLDYPYRVYERSDRRRFGQKRIWEVHIGQREVLERLASEVVLRGEKAAKLQAMVKSYPRRAPIDRAVSLYESGLSIKQVAAKLETPQSTVQLWLSGCGVSRTGAGRKSLPIPPNLADVFASEGSVVGVARVFGVAPGTAAKWVKASGIAQRQGRPRGRSWSEAERVARGK
jgi:hypothetical protein